MTPAARLQALAELYDAILQGQGAADRVLAAYLRERSFIGSSDRRHLTARFWRTLRNWQPLNWHCEQVNLPLNGRSLALLAELTLHGTAMEALAAQCDGTAYGPKPLSESESRILSALKHPEGMPAHIAANLLEWNHALLSEQYGEELHALLAGMDEEGTTTLRANRLKATPEQLMNALADAGIESRPGHLAPDAVLLNKRLNISALKVFQDGWCEPQDEASQLIALAGNPQPGMDVIDLCAGAGGKTLAMAAAMEDTGDILACDIDRNRLMELERRAKRAGISIVRTLLLDENLPIHKQLPKASADLVLVDAPCTGSGTWRRAPDSRWRYSAEDLQDFAATQRRLLDQAAQLARPGGAVVYATCSIYSVENQDIVDKIRKKHQYIVDAPLSGVAATVDKKNLESSTSCLQLTPHLHKTDGMFMAAFCHKDQ